MSSPKLIIYNLAILFDILHEINEKINYKIIKISNIDELNKYQKDEKKNYLVISNIKFKNYIKFNYLIIENKPVKLNTLIEKINLLFLKSNYSEQSKIEINDYTLNINSRELIKLNNYLKLTQKEVEIIIFLNDTKKNKSVTNLQREVWGYKSNLETHTVETHIYRLRKKILQKFNDREFIKNIENGYKI